MGTRAANVVAAAFTDEQTVRLTGISKRQLHYWDNTGFFKPSLAYENRRAPFSRIYSFRDVACLKVINALRNEATVPLPHLREVKEKLSFLGDDLWANTTLYVLNKRVIFYNPETNAKEEVVSGQGILQIPLKVVTGQLEAAARVLTARNSADFGKTERNRSIAFNQVVIAGTRIPVRSIKAFHEAGYSVKRILKEYPTLTEKDIRAAINYVVAA